MPPQRPLWLLALLLQVPPGAPAAENPTDAAGGSHLLLDSRWVAVSQNARLVLGTVQKHPGNPLMAEDQPWEARFDNLYANVIHDPADNLYKCWYSPFIVDLPAKGLTLGQRQSIRYRPPAGREMGVCYAVSQDGLLWEKPALNLVDFEGTKANNLVVRGPHGAGILLDPSDPDPERRYKMFRAEDMRYSADGLQWTAPETSTGILSKSDTHNNLLRVPESGRYVGFVRLWSDGWGRGQRIVGRTESADLQQWSRAAEVLRGDAQHQAYAMPVFRYAGVYLGLVAVFRSEEDRVHTELAWSPDTVSWQRIQPGTPFIGNSATEGDYDWGCIYAAASPVILEDGIRIYYGGSNGRHTSWRDGFLCLSTLRPDGWAGYEPQDPSTPALITTRPVECSADNLWITCDVTDGGKVQVTTLDEAGQPLDRATITQSGTRATAGRLLTFRNRPGKVNLEITKAKVYSFGFADDP
ncbi:MAG: hypothetical protein WBE58_22650 [Verrucomicrobiales bacterium]